jgi:hypothetical protein
MNGSCVFSGAVDNRSSHHGRVDGPRTYSRCCRASSSTLAKDNGESQVGHGWDMARPLPQIACISRQIVDRLTPSIAASSDCPPLRNGDQLPSQESSWQIRRSRSRRSIALTWRRLLYRVRPDARRAASSWEAAGPHSRLLRALCALVGCMRELFRAGGSMAGTGMTVDVPVSELILGKVLSHRLCDKWTEYVGGAWAPISCLLIRRPLQQPVPTKHTPALASVDLNWLDRWGARNVVL